MKDVSAILVVLTDGSYEVLDCAKIVGITQRGYEKLQATHDAATLEKHHVVFEHFIDQILP